MPGASGAHLFPDSLIVIGRYASVAEAHIVRGRLRAEGLFAVVADDRHASVAWFLTQALGGVRVLIRERDRDEARRALETEAPDPPDYDPIDVCPACGSDQVMRANSWLAGAAGVFAVAVPILVRTRRRFCHACGHRWRADRANS